MKLLLVTLAIGGTVLQPVVAQDGYNEAHFTKYSHWFYQHSPSEQFRTPGGQLYVFSEHTPLYAGNCESSELLTELPAGTLVENLSYNIHRLTEDQINGHDDWWFHVRARDAVGRYLEGYIWGGHIARAWESADLYHSGRPQLIMLGLSSEPLRHDLSNLQAELRIAERGQILYRFSIPGMCVFKNCGSQSMLRILNNHPQLGEVMLEASAFVDGCLAGIDKAFLYWSGRQLELVYMAEYTSGTVYHNNILEFMNGGERVRVQYKGEDANFNPVWQFLDYPQAIEHAKPNPVIRAVP